MQILVGEFDRDHLDSGVTQVTNRFLLITHDWKGLKTWPWSHCACLVTTHRLIYDMTYFGRHLTSLTWPWPEVNYWPHHSNSLRICFDAPCREEHDGPQNIPLAFLVQKMFALKLILSKIAILTFVWPLTSKSLNFTQIWRHARKQTVLELSSAFFSGLLPKIVSEIMAHFWEKNT